MIFHSLASILSRLFSMINSRSLAALLMPDSGVRRGFSPGALCLGVNDCPTFTDAADVLIDSKIKNAPKGKKGVLLLADGSRFEGKLFGSEIISQGELVFITGMTGYTRRESSGLTARMAPNGAVLASANSSRAKRETITVSAIYVYHNRAESAIHSPRTGMTGAGVWGY